MSFILKKTSDGTGRYMLLYIHHYHVGRIGKKLAGTAREIILDKEGMRITLPRSMVGRRFKIFIEFIGEKNIELGDDEEELYLKGYTCDRCFNTRLTLKKDTTGNERPYCKKCKGFSMW